MQLHIHIELDEPLVLPINYNHILQAIIYRTLSVMPDYSEFLHERGYSTGQRQYKMFQFSQLKGAYKITDKKIMFYSSVEFEIRSPEPLLIHLLNGGFQYDGITFGEKRYRNIRTRVADFTVEEQQLYINMKTPIVVYSTDPLTKYTDYYSPKDQEFYEGIRQNADNKYAAYYGVEPEEYIEIQKFGDTAAKKMVTKYQGHYIIAWYGKYILSGKRKYLDFLYQVGIGAKNSQGFGMFEIL